MKKQDSNGVRTPLDVERRHKLGAINTLEEDVDTLKEETTIDSSFSNTSKHAVQNKLITEALSLLNENKVDKQTGKGLSTNDFTNTYKSQLEELYGYINKISNIYPVGSVYLSNVAVDVDTLALRYGGTWVQGSNVGTYFSYIRTL